MFSGKFFLIIFYLYLYFMGFNKKIILEIEELKKLRGDDLDSYIKSVIKCDTIIGSQESIKWIEKKIKGYYEREFDK